MQAGSVIKYSLGRAIAPAALALLLCGTAAAETVHLRSEVDITKYAADITGELSRPPGDRPVPAVVLLHGCAGLVGAERNSLETYVRFFNANGFATLLLDSFGPRGLAGGQVCDTELARKAARHYRVYDAFAALAYLKALPGIRADGIFAMGRNNGASVAMWLADSIGQRISRSHDRFAAVVAYYPWCKTAVLEMLAPLVIFIGENDEWAHKEYCLYREANIVGEYFDVQVFPGAEHAFDWPGAAGLPANAAAAEASRKRMLEFFRQHLPAG